jgi:hypothetical protein
MVRCELISPDVHSTCMHPRLVTTELVHCSSCTSAQTDIKAHTNCTARVGCRSSRAPWSAVGIYGRLVTKGSCSESVEACASIRHGPCQTTCGKPKTECIGKAGAG